MRFKKINTIICTCLLIIGFILAYLYLGSNSEGLYGNPEAQKMELRSLEEKVKSLEFDLKQNAEMMNNIKGAVKTILEKEDSVQSSKDSKNSRIGANGELEVRVNKTLATIHQDDAKFAQQPPTQCKIEMDKIYDGLDFDNPDGGAWKQGWDVRYRSDAWDKRKLLVFVVPHSHNDPGWIKTFEKYYADQTSKILSNAVSKMKEFTNMKFIWAEISYLSLWWKDQPEQVRKDFIRLVQEGRMEIVTGGYVMPDEANSHYAAMLEQLIYGHEWCHHNLNGYKPNSGWSIDPFGMSPTMAYILKRSGFDNMLIQRTHYSIKKKLSQDRSLEFKWRQHWDHNSTTDMLCHMMPFYSYDVPHTCGPDPKVCCQFDFLRLPGGRASCPWRAPPRAINQANVAERSNLLLDQYRKKAQLYQTDVVLAPLGDDFRWDGDKEWRDQYENYQKIMDYVNSHPELKAEIHWGTLSDYFQAVRQRSYDSSGDDTALFPSLSGDFFTYADRDDHYWSGYFTSRPFWKLMDRQLGGYLRAAEIAFSLAWAEMEYIGADQVDLAKECMQKLQYARKMFGLFQHHDGITGTAKDHVVVDYGEKMMNSIQALQFVIQQSANYLLTQLKAQYTAQTDTPYFDLDDNRETSWSTPQKTVIRLGGGANEKKRLVVFNSHARKREQLVTFRVSHHNIKLYRDVKLDEDVEEEEDLPCQISPVFDEHGDIKNNEFDITFLASVPALGFSTYMLRELIVEEGSNPDLHVAEVNIYNSNRQPYQVTPFSSVTVSRSGPPGPIQLSSVYLTAVFSPATGLLQSVTNKESGVETSTKVEFLQYGTRSHGDKSGAYLFLPGGEGRTKDMGPEPPITVVKGKFRSYVEVSSAWNVHRAELLNSPGTDGTGIHLDNMVDLTENSEGNIEISMRVNSNIKSDDLFYTDLNGFQMIKRKRYSKLPLQGNWYPLPTMGYIQDSKSRMTLISQQPLGGTSLASGQLEVMLDRRLYQDDNRGLFQGVQDNKVTPSKFVLLVEHQEQGCQQEPLSQASYPSLLAHSIRHDLLNPLIRLIYQRDRFKARTLMQNYSPVDKDLDCDIHIVNQRTMLQDYQSMNPSDKAALVLHRQGFNGCYKPVGMTCSTSGGKVNLEELFSNLYSNSVHQMSLSLLYDGMKMEKSFTVSIQPMELYSFILTR